MYKLLICFMYILGQSFSVAALEVNTKSTWTESGIYQGIFYKLYAPKVYSKLEKTKKLPLVVALHGCKQNAEIFSKITRLNSWAENKKFIVLYPEQSLMFNIDHCWNWFLPINQKRMPIGELASLNKLVKSLLLKYPIDPEQIYTLGLSAGAAMANLYANCYIDQVSGVGIHSGLQFAAAKNPFEANNVLVTGSQLLSEYSAKEAFNCSRGINIPRKKELPTFIIVGTKDKRLNPINSEQILNQSLAVYDYLDDGLRNRSDNIILLRKNRVTLPLKYPFLISDFGKKGRHPLVKFLQVEGLAHAWSGGAPGFNNSDPNGVDATELILNFFFTFKKENYVK